MLEILVESFAHILVARVLVPLPCFSPVFYKAVPLDLNQFPPLCIDKPKPRRRGGLQRFQPDAQRNLRLTGRPFQYGRKLTLFLSYGVARTDFAPVQTEVGRPWQRQPVELRGKQGLHYRRIAKIRQINRSSGHDTHTLVLDDIISF